MPLFELGVVLEVFGPHVRPQWVDTWYEIAVWRAGRPGAASGRDGTPDDLRTALVSADTVILPRAWAGARSEAVETELRCAHSRGARLVAFGTGAFTLAAAGLLDGRRATTHWASTATLERDYPRVRVERDALYVEDDRILTSAGFTAALDLGLHIVQADHGALTAREVARRLVMPPHRHGAQAQRVTPVLESRSSSSGVLRVLEHLAENFTKDLALDEMASMAFMSKRNFSRRFREVTGTSPRRWLLEQRLQHARALLEGTDHSVEWVAHACGFGSVVSFRQRFVAEYDQSPSAYRRRFRERRHNSKVTAASA